MFEGPSLDGTDLFEDTTAWTKESDSGTCR